MRARRTLSLTAGLAALTAVPLLTPATTATASPACPAVTAVQTPAQAAQAAYDRLTTAQRIGQLFMVGGPATGLGATTESMITRYHVGNVVLTGRATTGAAPVRVVTSRAGTLATSAATGDVPLLVAADQEGGSVQVLQGTGFSRMPTALTQGTWSDATLSSNAGLWGRQVMRSGTNVDLAPVMDTVSKSFAASNQPIGRYQREYGYTTSVVADKGTAFLSAMRASGLAMTAKHFPGLGRVTGNTDVTAGVTDTVTTRTSADVAPFKAAVASGARVLMLSSAYYRKIDAARPAVFSPTVIGGMVRTDLRFTGIVMSDDLGNAYQVHNWTPAARAVDFFSAGGDMLLTVTPTVVPAMVSAVSARAASDATFRATVKTAVLRVLTVKAELGLLAPRLPVTGYFGSLTTASLRRWLDLPTAGAFDSQTVRVLQYRLSTTVDGVFGARTVAALQSYLGISRDGASGWNARTVAQLQRYLNTQL
ncbi:hypothetical protein GCM10023258_20810 [Terrabacter aeriphilus]|uniref:beta-N-acetylhexosaminidase n=1 Tax=Terrabacter aeriphilus TaxID=515662 RepID=A0ABP9JDC4_9MICO